MGRADEAAAIVRGWRQAGPLTPPRRMIEAIVLLQSKDPAAPEAIKSSMAALTGPNPTGQIALQAVRRFLPFFGRFDQREAAIHLGQLAAAHGQYPAYDWLMSDDRLATIRADPRFAPVLAGSKAEFVAMLKVVDAARARNELPTYLVGPLTDLRARMGF